MEHATRGMRVVREPRIEVKFLIGKCIFEPWCWALQRSKKSWVTMVGHGHYKVLITRAVACKLGSECLAGRFPSNLKSVDTI